MLYFGKPPARLLRHLGIVVDKPGQAPWMTGGTSRVIDGIDATAEQYTVEQGFVVLHGRRVEVLGGHLFAYGSMRIGVTNDGIVTATNSSVQGLKRARVLLRAGADAELYNDCTFVARDDSIVHVYDNVSGTAHNRATVHIYEGATGRIRFGKNVTVRDRRLAPASTVWRRIDGSRSLSH